jgi:hypothetical protein
MGNKNPNQSGLTNFQKGNQASVGYGRPKGKCLKTLFRKIAEEQLTLKNSQGEKETKTTEEWIVISHAQNALKGSARHIDMWYDRLYGKVTNTIEVSDIRDKKAQDLTTEELESFLQEDSK